ncbi:MAG: hypothetical protein P8L47_03690 [Candidatus Marinamargulisbacteria bacterium]|nr:hypothetical protein [Candidatus Marinamargulisbacteria bacterium]
MLQNANLCYANIELAAATRDTVAVFARRSFQPGDLIERAPYTVAGTVAGNQPTRYSAYSIYHSPVDQWITLLGFGNYYTVHNSANARLAFHTKMPEKPENQYVDIIADRLIEPGHAIVLPPAASTQVMPTNLMAYYANICIDQSPLGGRGVFAKKEFKENEIIEIAPYIKDNAHKTGTGFGYNVFSSTISGDSDIFVMGYGSLYNHSGQPNVYYELYMPELAVPYAQFYVYKAKVPIAAHAECCISYGESYWESRGEELKNKDAST